MSHTSANSQRNLAHFSAVTTLFELQPLLAGQALQVNIPTFAFIDLPGLQSYPEQHRIQSEALVNKYISDTNRLVLCVISATDATLDSGSAFRVLTAADKLQSTILALTKSDKVHEDDAEDQILKRILKMHETSAWELGSLQECVAVMNRKHQNTHLSLEDAAVKESQLFAKMLAQAPEAYQTEAMQQALVKGMTREQLMVALDRMYHHHIVSTWRDQVLTNIQHAQQQVDAAEEVLGKDPATMNVTDVMNKLYAKVSWLHHNWQLRQDHVTSPCTVYRNQRSVLLLYCWCAATA